MTNPTPEYEKGDRVELEHKKAEGIVVNRWWSEGNESWVYTVKRDGEVNIYQERHLNQ